MEIAEVKTGRRKLVRIQKVEPADYKKITKGKFFFDWRTEKDNRVYKLIEEESNEIVGLISLIHKEDEQRFEINLLAVSKENRGSKKIYEGIAGNLIAYACREAIKWHAIEGCVSLIPKTVLRKHYLLKYGMMDAGIAVFLEGKPLLDLLKKYKV